MIAAARTVLAWYGRLWLRGYTSAPCQAMRYLTICRLDDDYQLAIIHRPRKDRRV